MHQLKVTITQEDPGAPDRERFSALLRTIARRVGGSLGDINGGEVADPDLSGRWDLTVYELAAPDVPADVSASVSRKVAFIDAVLHDIPLAPGEPNGITLTRADVRSIFLHGMDVGSTMPAVPAPDVTDALTFAEVKALAAGGEPTVDARAAALARKVAEALEAGGTDLLGETERLIIYRVLRDASGADSG
jgi:hypothetical protein